ncbi:amidohydrolase family protein [Lachnospiraceae bacterium OttesenSCG-928-E19]|nr:amidohydrolase family protein [Lachnospiraceae bacterium OttesenSCG-928-E19]
MEKEFTKLIIAKHLFDGISDLAYEGYLCLKNEKIVKTGRGEPNRELVEQAEDVIRFEEELVMPGIIDTHTFFTGYAVFHVGADVSKVCNNQEGLKVLKDYQKEKEPEGALLGHGWNPEKWDRGQGEEMLEQEYPHKAVVLFSEDRSTCIMNAKAKEEYGFTSETCYPESYWKIQREFLNDREFIEKEFSDYMSMMNARGVTTVKEMGFDDFYGFTDYLREVEESNNLRLRVFFMSQPTGRPMDLPYARRMREMFKGEKVRFSGFNRMTDGTIADYKGDLKTPYENKDFCCSIEVPYDEIEADVLAADAENFRWSLHAQGDGAVGKIADIYEKCKKEDGKLKNKHAITDMEFTDPKDLERLGEIGATAELYFQIMSLDPGDVLVKNIMNTIGPKRKRYYWNRRKMQDSGMVLSGATDLPLLLTSVPESIYYSCIGYLDGEDTPFQQENTLKIYEMLKAWTIGGAKNLSMEEQMGTLEEGKFADIAIFDRNLLSVKPQEAKEAKVMMTIMDGEVVYSR